ncbi:hypothetical protein AVEN_213107-1, partial [Araneus ventricosus]
MTRAPPELTVPLSKLTHALEGGCLTHLTYNAPEPQTRGNLSGIGFGALSQNQQL